MADHRKRFERWRTKLPEHTHYLVDQVLARIVPEFEARGFKWYGDFAGGDPKEISYDEIPLQRREGERWSTVQIQFDKRARPFFHISFAVLPLICRKMFGTQEILREKAINVYAPAHFRLTTGKRLGDGFFGSGGMFGYSYFALAPSRKIDAEIDKAVALLPVLFDLFDRGIPEAWLTHDFGYVDKHVMLMGSWHLNEQRRAKQKKLKGLN
jgi:hypothetical protein